MSERLHEIAKSIVSGNGCDTDSETLIALIQENTETERDLLVGMSFFLSLHTKTAEHALNAGKFIRIMATDVLTSNMFYGDVSEVIREAAE